MKFNFNFIMKTTKRLDVFLDRVRDISSSDGEVNFEPFTLETVVSDSFITDIQSKIIKKNLRKNQNNFHSKFDLNNKVSDFRKLLQKEIFRDAVNFTKENNFTYSQVRTLQDFLINKPFKILGCDKNVGNALINKSKYLGLAYDFLAKDPSYTELDSDPLENTVKKINYTLDKLFLEAEISFDLRKALKIKESEVKLGNFKLLAKLHKKEFGWRPILNSIGHPTSNICFLIDKIFQPYVIKTDSYIKDSQNLLQICENTRFTSEPHLYSLDFSSLYSNINPTLAIPTIADFFKNRIQANNFTIRALVLLLKIIFDHNIFKFGSKFYVQNKGLAMGCICGPSLANLYLHILEKSWLNLIKPSIYVRFIDDIFMALDTELNLEQFTKSFHNLQLTMTTGKEVVFLDTIISFNKGDNKIKFDLYTKPTNNGNYLLPESFHPRHIINNIPKNLMTRNKRICSYYVDFCFHTLALCISLLKRGYDKKKLILDFRTVSKINRSKLIPYIVKSNNKKFFTPNSISFKNSSLESLSNNNTVFLNNLNASVKTVANMNNVLEKDSCFTSNKGMIAAEQNNPCNISQGAIENVNNNTSNCTYRVKRDSINNENTALCQNARSESSGTTRKEKKTSVGYRLGKRKLLFEKRKLFQA